MVDFRACSPFRRNRSTTGAGFQRETEVIEFKEAKNQYDNTKLCRYCVAIANEGGGYLVLGVRDQKPRIVVGTQAFNNLPGICEKLFAELNFRVDAAETLHTSGGRVVTFRIPGRPPATPLQYKGEYLMRSGTALVSMTPDVLRRIFTEKTPDWLEEPATDRIGAAKVVELLDTEAYFRLINLQYPLSFDGIMAQLLRDRLVIEELHGAYSVKRLTALMLAKELSAFPEIERKAARIISYQGTSKLDSVTFDRTATKGYAAGFQNMVQRVSKLLPKNEVIQDALRTEVNLIPEVAVRELVANALIHQDLNLSGSSVMIEIFTDRLEISNPGEPIIAVDRLIDGYQSRNERLAAMMRKMRICEERGRGVDEVVRTAEIFQLPAPQFRAIEGRTQVIIFGHRRFEDMDRDDRTRACYQHCVLKYVMSERMTNQTLRKRFGLPQNKSRHVSQIIAATIDAGYIRADDDAGSSKKYACYLPAWA